MLGDYRHVVTLEAPGPPAPDGNGGYTETWAPLVPAVWHCAIEPATAGNLETVGSGTVLASASHVLRGHYHAGITSTTRVRFGSRTFNVVGPPAIRDERPIETVVPCAEVVV